MDADLPIELRGVAEELEQGSGFWRSCSGCHESNEGVPTGPFSAVFKCHLGGGCRECGGLGAVWDDTDYDDMADFMAQAEAGVPACPKGKGDCAKVLPDKRCFGCPANAGVLVPFEAHQPPAQGD